MSQFIRRQHLTAFALGAMAVSLLAGDTVVPEPRQSRKTGDSPDLVQCTQPRPQMCIQLYLPVCAELRNGARRTYPSGCAACSDATVAGYRPNRCE